MTRIAAASLLGILALFLSAAASQSQSPQHTANRVIAGIVKSDGGQPLAGANVTLQDTNGFKPVADTTTDDAGRFSFTNLPEGKYVLTAAHRGYVETTYEYHDGPFTAIVTGENLDTTGLVLSLSPLGSIFGTVAEDSGDPVQGAQIMLFRKEPHSDTERVIRAGLLTADAMGNFEVSSLAPGTYFLCASGRPWYRHLNEPAIYPMSAPGRDASAPIAPSTDQPRSSLDVTYALTCYPDTTDPAGAEEIALKGGDHTEANVTVHPVPALHVRFQMPQDGTRGISMPQLRQDVFGFSDFASSVDTVPFTGSDDPGHATVELAVPPGQYEIEQPGLNSAQDPGRHGTIEVASTDVNIDTSSLQPMASLAGSLVVDGGLPDRCSILLVSKNGDARASGPVGADGKFQIFGTPPGEYEVRLNANGFYYSVTRLSVQGERVDGNTLEVGSDPINLTVFARRPMASIRGFVSKNGKPTSGIFLVLVPANPGANRFAWQQNQSDSDGSFIFQNVNPGHYTVVAINEGWTLDWSQVPVITPFLAGGAQVTVEPTSKEVKLPSPVEAQAIGAPHSR